MKIFDSSLVLSERENEFKPILSAILDPLIQACTISATRLGVSEISIFMANCLYVIQVKIEFKFNSHFILILFCNLDFNIQI